MSSLLTLCAVASPLVEFKGPQTFDGRLGTMEHLADVPRLTAFTLTAWVNVTGDGEGDKPYGRIIDGPGFYFHVATSLRKGAANSVLAGNTRDFFAFTFGVPLGNGKISAWSSGQIAKARQWVHVALQVPDGEKTLPKLFVNGKESGLFRDARPRPTPIAGGTYAVANGLGGRRPFEGRLANVAIHEWELSADEIAALAAKDPEGNPPQEMRETFADELPIADISRDASRQTVIAAGTEETYQGHPTTLLADDGRTMFCVWTINHGGGCGPFAKSTDGGRTWTRIDGEMPADFKFHRNCPTLQKVPRPDGGFNFCVYSANCKPGAGGGLGILASRDGGVTWQVMPPAPQLESGMPPTGFMPLKDGSCALFGQHRKVRGADDAPTSDQDIWMAVSKDGGLTWGEPRIVATAEQKNLCEPCCLRSPDGAELCLLMRENRHTARSMMCFSRDEGKTWTKPVDTPWGLTGDRHEAILLPDGRYVIAFRDQALGSSTWGQYVAWVGTWADIRACRPGQYRIHLLEHQGGRRPSGGYLSGDTGYSGVELLPDGTIVCTTYMKYWADARKHSVVTTRFRIAETDAMVKRAILSVWSVQAKSVLVFNEDDSHFFGNPAHASEEVLREYVDRIAAGGHVTHFFMCPNAMRANFDSKVFEPAWAPCDVPGWKQNGWSRMLKVLHDKGIDPYSVWAKRCRERGISPWLSMRMNDVHFVNDLKYGGHSKFWREHPEFWREPNTKSGAWEKRALDFAHPEVRKYALAFVEELLERYDVDGIECDWMRFPNHLTPGRERELSPCLNGFMKEVRRLANQAAARLGHPVRVAARVDSDPEAALARGTDAFAWAREGSVDWIVPCNFFNSVDFELPFAEWKSRMAAANPTVRVIPGLDAGVIIKGVKGRRMLTVPEYRGWAHRVYGQGAEGVYLFNLFTHGDKSEVMTTILREGLAPETVREKEKSIPANAVRECLNAIRKTRTK